LYRKVKGGESILVEAEIVRVRDKKPEDKVEDAMTIIELFFIKL
jgi:hypothetical protein